MRGLRSQNANKLFSATNFFSEALNREREENRRLREEMHQLAHVQSHKRDAAPLVDTRQELEDKKRIFETTVQRVKSKYFGYRRENVCSDVEQVCKSYFMFFIKIYYKKILETRRMSSRKQKLGSQLQTASTRV